MIHPNINNDSKQKKIDLIRNNMILLQGSTQHSEFENPSSK